MEIFDVVDIDGNPTGETVGRDEAHDKGIKHRTAHVWVVRKEGENYEVLMQKRAANKESFPGRFDTSLAGHIQKGDEPLESAIRELSEELGIFAKPSELDFAGKFDIQYEKEFYGKMFRDNEVSFVYVFTGIVDMGELKLQEEEVESVEWFRLDEVVEECKAHNPKFCAPIGGLEILCRYLGLTELL